MSDLRIFGLQYDIVWKDKKANFKKIEALESKIEEADIVVLPEMFQTGFCFDSQELSEDFDNSYTIKWLHEQAAKTNAVWVGSAMINEGDKVYNRLIWMPPNGDFLTYDKRHLFSMSEEPGHFTAGAQKLVVEYKGWKICPMVCYDLRFPVWIRNTEAYDLLLFVANWPERRSVHWEKLLEARAIENQCYVVGINRVGNDGNGVYHDGKSAFINPMGEKMEFSIHHETILEAELIKTEIENVRSRMPFLQDADKFTLL